MPRSTHSVSPGNRSASRRVRGSSAPSARVSSGWPRVAQSDLEIQARSFAKRLRDLLNKTVCSNALVGAWLVSADSMFVGTGVGSATPYGRPIGLSVSNKAPHCWVKAGYFVVVNKDGFLTVSNSFVGVSADADGDNLLVHYDFERDKDKSPAEDERYTEAPKSLHKLHFPVGGRRFRPCLEDVIEFLIRERLVVKKAGWERVLQASRQDFHDQQLGAAIRYRPETAIRELGQMGYDVVKRPEVPTKRVRRR